MLKKVHICDKDFKKVLLEHIDAENIPSFLGGTCTCSHMPGGCVPSVILNNISPLTSSLPLTPTSTRPSTPIPPESKKRRIYWAFAVVEGVKFGVKFIKADSKTRYEEKIMHFKPMIQCIMYKIVQLESLIT
ncbi:uncharacterized protein OCT59_017549 [Rhizophagus irregularis]|uniref:Uncharacterized protein n=1 Tax=Rhizophagus irregularis TaxID=588596 RepID=A0A916E7N3_9GLOM|nr:hypothetical protein OCT59_017549 [Rhizophagus irregularis]CAB5366219.1 unnamed protein product [Rhizophagus irregularis]